MNPEAELPFQTYERLMGQPWPGGRAAAVVQLLKFFRIDSEPGSAEANLKLQACLREWWHDLSHHARP
jgi:hypothetical protein